MEWLSPANYLACKQGACNIGGGPELVVSPSGPAGHRGGCGRQRLTHRGRRWARMGGIRTSRPRSKPRGDVPGRCGRAFGDSQPSPGAPQPFSHQLANPACGDASPDYLTAMASSCSWEGHCGASIHSSRSLAVLHSTVRVAPRAGSWTLAIVSPDGVRVSDGSLQLRWNR